MCLILCTLGRWPLDNLVIFGVSRFRFLAPKTVAQDDIA